ncbi:MFS general substrate transporter [Phanerochaete sordida]|uniref:MFS general substrate transporter n=1 Tax=Phanerochaete sordida TaxID=48140 RepID=A0A9P3LAY3_9APHY|nr:MFS general substrate transporter [Phanerochaete sordida]
MDSGDTRSSSEKASVTTPAGSSLRDAADTMPQCAGAPPVGAPVEYRLYKRRFVGVVGFMLLNIVAAMPNPWYGPIANNVSKDFGFTLDQVNWLGNVLNVVFVPSALLVPIVCRRFDIRITCYIASFIFVIAAWIRYAGVAPSLNKEGSYAIMLVGQIITGVVHPTFQVLAPAYSERWFDAKSRTTMTMFMSIANPVGGAIAQLISPHSSTPQFSLLVLAIISTAVMPCALLILNAPPTPPTYAASQPRPPFMSLVRALSGREPRDRPTYMTLRERIDFAILTLNFGVLVGAVNSYTLLSDQILAPYGYQSHTSGLMGATILISGVVCALVTSPLSDRVFTHHTALMCKIICPTLGVLWLSLIWAVKPNDAGGMFAIMALIGGCSITLLPLALELAIELTRNASGSVALQWFAGNLMGVIFVHTAGALRAGPDANPPLNMHRALIFLGAFVCSAVVTIFGLRGRQARREMDERVLREGVEMQVVECDWEQGKGEKSDVSKQ